jgi:hypothetical protein
MNTGAETGRGLGFYGKRVNNYYAEILCATKKRNHVEITQNI